jgi:hypothetical protein
MSTNANGSSPSTVAADNSADRVVLDPALLAELTRALLPYLGPYSITTVKRAARGADSAQDLVRQIGTRIEDVAKRELFLKSAIRISQEFAQNKPTSAAAPSEESSAAGATSRPSTPVTPELVKRGEAALAPIIGPLASVLVTRYAGASKNSREFFERLAGHLRTPEERDSFFMSVRTGNGTWRPQ